MIETILGKDGITPEMIKAQQERLNVIDRLLAATTPEVRSQLIKDNSAIIDEQFFILFSRLLQAGLGGGQEALAKQLGEVQSQLLEETEIGRQLKESAGELEAATKALQEAGPSLTREKLLDLIVAAPNEARLKAYTSLARSGMDYVFFQTLTERIEKAPAPDRKKLEALREKLLALVNDVDKQLEARYKQAQKLIDRILAEEDVAKATQANLEAFSQDAVDIVQSMHRQASEKNDYAQMGKLQKMIEILQAASAPPPEVALIEQLLELPDDAVEKALADNEALVNDAFIESLNGLVAQLGTQAEQGSADAAKLAPKLQAIYKSALKLSMKKKMAA